MELRRVRGVVWDLGNVLIDWDPTAAIAAGVGDGEARRFLASFDFREWNHGPDSGGSWEDAEAWLDAEHPQWSEHGRAYRPHFARSLIGEVPGSVAVVRELHAAGVPQWGLTNWSAELYPQAPARFDFLALLTDVVVSGVEGVASLCRGATFRGLTCRSSRHWPSGSRWYLLVRADTKAVPD